VANGDRILALDQRGTLMLLDAGAGEFAVMDSAPVSKAETWAHLAVAGDTLFVRDLGGVTAWRWGAAAAAPAVVQ
jgi:hypothetical protein